MMNSQFDREAFRQKYNEESTFLKNAGAGITVLGEHYAEAELVTCPDHANISGIVHGGVLYSLADAAAGAASKSTGEKTVTLEGKINYLRPVAINGKTLKAVAKPKHVGRTTSVYECEVYAGEEILAAVCLFTFYTLSR